MERDFLKSVRKAIRMLGRRIFADQCSVTEYRESAENYDEFEILVAAEFRSEFSGVIFFRSSKNAANSIASSFFGIGIRDERKAVTEGASEFLNQLLGTVKRLYVYDSTGFEFSIPAVVPEKRKPESLDAVGSFEVKGTGKAVFIDIFRK